MLFKLYFSFYYKYDLQKCLTYIPLLNQLSAVSSTSMENYPLWFDNTLWEHTTDLGLKYQGTAQISHISQNVFLYEPSFAHKGQKTPFWLK